MELTQLWLATDSEIPLYEFLRITRAEYIAYAERRLTAEDIMVMYNART